MRWTKYALVGALMIFAIFSVIRRSKATQPNDFIQKEMTIFSAKAPDLDSKVLKLALTAYQSARRQGLDDKELLTVIDYSMPSTQKRLWLLNIADGEVDQHTLVAHGKNSGANYATSFSNKVGSLKSSVGLYLTANSYVGHRGYALKLKGLEPGINDRAFRRAVVIHGAPYVSQSFADKYGRLGRSWGCPAVSKQVIKPLVDEIKQGTLVFAYYPDSNWLAHSRFLNA